MRMMINGKLWRERERERNKRFLIEDEREGELMSLVIRVKFDHKVHRGEQLAIGVEN